MRQLLSIGILLVFAPWLAVVYIIIRVAWEAHRRHVNAERNRFSTPMQRHRFDELQQEREFRVRNVGQTVL
jgi:hypothetical protein